MHIPISRESTGEARFSFPHRSNTHHGRFRSILGLTSPVPRLHILQFPARSLSIRGAFASSRETFFRQQRPSARPKHSGHTFHSTARTCLFEIPNRVTPASEFYRRCRTPLFHIVAGASAPRLPNSRSAHAPASITDTRPKPDRPQPIRSVREASTPRPVLRIRGTSRRRGVWHTPITRTTIPHFTPDPFARGYGLGHKMG